MLDQFSKELIFKHQDMVSVFALKSDTHAKLLQEARQTTTNIAADPKILIQKNGLRLEFLKAMPPQVREPYRFIYASCYTRGLLHLLQHIWPTIVAKQPLAELHVYYGMDHVTEPLKSSLRTAFGNVGVIDHGRRPFEEVALAKARSSFHLYITDAPAEIDCISIRESAVLGCIPLLSNSGVFASRPGIHYSNFSAEHGPAVATHIASLANNQTLLNDIRFVLAKQEEEDWDKVAAVQLHKFNSAC
jgi:hypothetical protein